MGKVTVSKLLFWENRFTFRSIYVLGFLMFPGLMLVGNTIQIMWI